MGTPTTDVLLGLLTTTFTPAAACTSLTVDALGGNTFAAYVYPRLFSSIAKSCFPSGYPLGNAAYTATYSKYNWHDEHVYYSPGLCPSGWGSNVAGTSGSETTVFCCGPGFAPLTLPAVTGGGSSTLCGSSLKGTVVTTVAYTGDGSVDGTSSAYTFGATVIPAPALWMRFDSADFAAATTTTIGAASSSASPSSNPPVPSTTAIGGASSSASPSSNPPVPSTTATSSSFLLHSSLTGASGSTTVTASSGQSSKSQTSQSIAATSSTPGQTPGSSNTLSTKASSVSNPTITAVTGAAIVSSSGSRATPFTSSNGLPESAKIGLAVGIPLAVIAVVSIFAFCFIRKRRAKEGLAGVGSGKNTSASFAFGPFDTARPSELPAGDNVVGRSELAVGNGVGSLPAVAEIGNP